MRIKPALVYHPTTGQENEVPESTIIVIEGFKGPEGFQ